MYQNKNALSSVESHLLGDNIRNEEAIRPGAVVLLSSEPRAESEKVEWCSQYTVTEKRKQDFLAKSFSIPTLSIEYSSGHLFFISHSTICDISIIPENKAYAHHKTHLHTRKVYSTQPVSLIIDHWSNDLFQSTDPFRKSLTCDFYSMNMHEVLQVECVTVK